MAWKCRQDYDLFISIQRKVLDWLTLYPNQYKTAQENYYKDGPLWGPWVPFEKTGALITSSWNFYQS